MLDDLKKRIKEVGKESNKYIANPGHPYHKLGGVLKAQIIFLYIGIGGLVITNLYIISLLVKVNGRFAIKMLRYYYGIPNSAIIFIALILIAVDIYCFAILIIMIRMIMNKDKNILLFMHCVCIIGFMMYVVSLFVNFSRGVSNIISLIIGCIAVSLYYLLSVRVRVYFGGDEFIRRDYFIRFLLEPETSNNYTYINNQLNANKTIGFNNIENATDINQNNIITNEKKVESNVNSEILNNCRKVNDVIEQFNNTESKESKENIENKESIESRESRESVPIEDLDKEVKAEVVNLNASIPKAVISQAIARNVETDNKIKNDKKEADIKVEDTKPKVNSNANACNNSKNENVKVVKYYIKEKQKKRPVLNVFKALLSSIIKISVIVILFFVLLNFNRKYRITESPIIQNIYTTIDNAFKNIFHFEIVPPNSVVDDSNIAAESNSSIDDNSNKLNVDSNSNINNKSDHQNNNNTNPSSETNILDNRNNIVKIEKNATKITAKVRKLGKTIATWKYNKTKGVWNLYVGKKKSLAKNVVYIMDYTSPITGEPCSSTYYFDKDGKLVTGWGIDENGDYYYFNDDQYDIGKMCTGWKTIDGDEYYFAPNGKLLTDTTTPDGKYVDINGKKH